MKILYIFILFFLFSCSTTKNVFNTINNKTFIGNVKSVTYIKYGYGLKSTLIITDIDESLFICYKIRIGIGTPCYVYSNPTRTKIYLIWDCAKKSYEIK
jgi:hypothetical protein